MNVTLTTQTKEIKNGEIIKHKQQKVFLLDTSLAAQIRYEAIFPNLAQQEDLFGYAERIFKVDELSVAIIISKMKVLYCFFETDMTFVEFLKLFDFSDVEYVKTLIEELKECFLMVFNSSSEKNS